MRRWLKHIFRKRWARQTETVRLQMAAKPYEDENECFYDKEHTLVREGELVDCFTFPFVTLASPVQVEAGSIYVRETDRFYSLAQIGWYKITQTKYEIEELD